MKMILNWFYSQAFKFPALRPPGLYDGRYSVIFSLSVTSPTVAESAYFSLYSCLFFFLSLHPSPVLLLFLRLLRQDKSTPEGQSSWDSFKNMTPELSIVPGEQKERMELHNKNWDSSSANTPDSSEGDFQTEV